MLLYIKKWLARLIYKGSYAPGHFYNPIPNVKEVKKREGAIFKDSEIDDLPLRGEEQLDFLQNCLSFYNKFPYLNKERTRSDLRYSLQNNYFNATDALGLFLILNFFKPKRIIEVGSGFSSAVMLDAIDISFSHRPEITFIEPFPDRLNTLLKKTEAADYTLIQELVQNVDLNLFKTLERGDILFIDSSHISKAGSDVNHIIFKILPVLQKGVIIHFHDIFYPFEYPKEWIYDGIYWNEAYLLRAFLMNNDAYKILLFHNFLHNKHKDWLSINMPMFQSGASIYIQKNQ